MQKTTLVILASMFLLSACNDEKVVVQKSPCVGIDNSPCGPKRPVNGKLNSTVENNTSSTRVYA